MRVYTRLTAKYTLVRIITTKTRRLDFKSRVIFKSNNLNQICGILRSKLKKQSDRSQIYFMPNSYTFSEVLLLQYNDRIY